VSEILSLSHCGGPYDFTTGNFETGWQLRPTTLAEQAVISFFKSSPRIAGMRLFHVGIGSSSIFRAFGHQLAAFVGLTLSLPEKVHFEEVFGRPCMLRFMRVLTKDSPKNRGFFCEGVKVVVEVVVDPQ
jgi:hypothetical protein